MFTGQDHMHLAQDGLGTGCSEKTWLMTTSQTLVHWKAAAKPGPWQGWSFLLLQLLQRGLVLTS